MNTEKFETHLDSTATNMSEYAAVANGRLLDATDPAATHFSEKTEEIIAQQMPMDAETIARVKNALARRGGHIEQSAEADNVLIANGKEACIFSDGTIVMHAKVSASGFYEELIHYGQIESGRTIIGCDENHLLMEIEAKKRLLAHQSAYKITDYEMGVIRESLQSYEERLRLLREGSE